VRVTNPPGVFGNEKSLAPGPNTRDGVLNVRKPSGPTSHDIVDKVRRFTGTKRVGHAGTLDPLASGVLVVFVGKATRMIEYMPGEPKVYTAGLLLGLATDTGDITGTTIEEASAENLTEDQLRSAVKKLRGVIEQVPPMHSAIKRDGKKLYELAREGKTVERAPRRVTIYDIEMQDFAAGEKATATLTVSCSSGTYIRTLCEDIGKQLGLPACMSSLVRNKVGRFGFDDAWDMDELGKLATDGRIEEALLPISCALVDLPGLICSEEQSFLLKRGNPIEYEGTEAPGVLLSMTDQNGVLVGVGVILKENARLIVKPEKILV